MSDGMPRDRTPRRSFIQGLAAGALAVPAGALAAGAFSGRASEADAPLLETPAGPATNYVFNVLDFGAVGDGKATATRAIQAAIDACGKAGGGKVVVPPGKYLTAPLFLKSNMQLEVMAGATLLGTTNFADYPAIQGRWEGINRTVYASLITGLDLENVSVTGGGTLEGQGPIWWDVQHKINAARRQMGLGAREPDNPPGSALKWPRPRMINIYRSRNVRISGVTIQNSPSWTVHPVLCEDVWIEGIRILSPRDTLNTDGIDPDSCRNVRISDCYISTGDDCVVIKSGYRYQPGNPYPPSENIVVSNCVFGFGHGGVVIGSETAGGVRNVVASNCVCDGTRRGLYFKTARGRGNIVENVRAVNFVMRNIVDTAVLVSMFYTSADRNKAMPVDEFTPTMRSIHCSQITIHGAKRSVVIEGLPENPIQSLGLNDVRIISAGTGVQCSEVRGMTFENVVANPDSGAAVSLANVRDVELLRVRTEKPDATQPAIRMEGVQNAVVQSCSSVEGRPALLEVKGAENKGISLALNRVPKGMKEVAFMDGAAEDAVSRRV
jgi:glycosyl hydrolase family 28